MTPEEIAARLPELTGAANGDDAMGAAQASLDRAAREAAPLRYALNGARQATAWLCRPAAGGEDR